MENEKLPPASSTSRNSDWYPIEEMKNCPLLFHWLKQWRIVSRMEYEKFSTFPPLGEKMT
jgi:hypothetical protein